MPSLLDDPRIDPRVKRIFGTLPTAMNPGDVPSREVLLEEANSAANRKATESWLATMDTCDKEPFAPQEGLCVSQRQFTSQPDGNNVNLQIIRPASDQVLPCLYYIHGGGMMSMSCFLGNYRAWGKILASQGLVVVMVDFRNALTPSSVPEVEPFPAGLNDCVSGALKINELKDEFKLDIDNITMAGESGGGNLALATAMVLAKRGEISRIKGLYALCPYIAGTWPLPENPSSSENNGLVLELHNNRGAIAYGIDELANRNPLAWPGFAQERDVKDFPPTTISVNECDPLRDEGVNFYRLLLRSGVTAYCRQVMGTTHGLEVFPMAVPEISRETAGSIAAFAHGTTR